MTSINPYLQIELFQKGMMANPAENSPQGFQERMKLSPGLFNDMQQASIDRGPYDRFAENSPTGFRQREQFNSAVINERNLLNKY